ncbi:DUF4181 domain-containing protein [Halalkalibacter urbisdiaboli]|uniref:DUF4181 domain-containing protein n=1 Tax=Halalkalibacter urbisdiaboli TaxID=1960589 RepID=UPI000B441908|nr:DUF4181 domain-containing protein [Halalkalibacter urbisdiaboli]
MKYVVFLIVLLILMLLIEKLTNKILGVQKKKVSETPGKIIDRWGRGIILVIFLSALWFVITNDSDKILKLFWMTYLALLLGFQAIMEFIYIKDSKQYISTTILLILGLIIIYNIEFLLGWISS